MELDKSNSWINQRERKFIRESVSEAIRELEELKKERDEAIRQKNVAEKNMRAAKLWSPEGQLLTTLTGHKGYVNAITFSPDGKTILTASADKTAKRWMMPQTFLAERVQKFSLQEFHDAGVQLEPDDLARVQPVEKAT